MRCWNIAHPAWYINVFACKLVCFICLDFGSQPQAGCRFTVTSLRMLDYGGNSKSAPEKGLLAGITCQI